MPIFTILAAICLAVALACIAPAAKGRAAASEVLYDGQAWAVHTLVDKAQGKSWRFIVVDRGPLLIPGSEAPWREPVERGK